MLISKSIVQRSPTQFLDSVGQVCDLSDIENIRIDVEHIAYSLSNTCRFNGNTKFFYSNAQHSLLVSFLCKEKSLKLACLLHDAHEAYIGDIITPLSGLINKEKLDEIKFDLDVQVASQLNVPELIDKRARDVIKFYDIEATNGEAYGLLENAKLLFKRPTLDITIKQCKSKSIYNYFLDRYDHLQSKKGTLV